ncbi:CoA pyrophosphatase [Novosphingobium sp. 9]|uniref:CoA pyrophosphatase n=1 Tax=Novosphingobium sp. 9 TaxID=2025349 RepID=UPI0021B52B3F|nr:CoA pyrophosphatase [Novosphingobium sp. 9]
MSDLFQRVAQRLTDAHAEQPPMRLSDPRLKGSDLELKPASVLIALTERDNPGILMLHRPSTMRAHPGQIALPGGRRELGENATEAALREAEEELGIPSDLVRVVGATDVYRTGSGYEITPVIGVIPPDIEIRPNAAEVSQWFEAPADFVLDPANQRTRLLERNGQQYPVIEIDWQGHVIWGVTGAILSNLARRLNWHDETA